MSPDLVIVEVTYPNSQEIQAGLTNHLTPQLLEREITGLQQFGGKVPRFFATHFCTPAEEEIKEELRLLAASTGVSITPAQEGLVVAV